MTRGKVWRMAQFERKFNQAIRVQKRNSYGSEARPDPLADYTAWEDSQGNARHYHTWEDIFAFRAHWARRNADNMTRCSCWMCGNPRRHHGAVTLQELRWFDRERNEFDEESIRALPVRAKRKW